MSRPPSGEPGPKRHRLALGIGLLLVALSLSLLVATRSDPDPVRDERTAARTEIPPSRSEPQPDPTGAPPPAAGDDEAGSAGDEESIGFAGRTRRLESAIGIPPTTTGPRPMTISFPSIGVRESSIDGVGVEANGELEVPGPRRVGWYEFGPRPGEGGSAVLAAHIASDGIDGVFRHLADVSVGDEFGVTFDDGTSMRYRVTELSQYDKNDLPLDRVFAKDGMPVVTLITCGGAFQPSVRSYEDNVVAYASPVDPS